MKKIFCVVVGIIIAVCGAVALFGSSEENNEYLRLHIRANSNSEYDQSIKYKIKDCVVDALKPLASEITSKEKMIEVLNCNLDYIKGIIDNKLIELGQTYQSTVKICEEKFPTRSYEELTLKSGVYDALIIELGTGAGDNWWCVAFPPLCFVAQDNGSNDIVYKSKIKELIEKYIK